jgi:hypothetical protein
VELIQKAVASGPNAAQIVSINAGRDELITIEGWKTIPFFMAIADRTGNLITPG